MPRCSAVLVTLLFAAICGCASTPRITTVSSVIQSPLPFKNELVELTAAVIENPAPAGDAYRTWTFVVGSSPAERILVSEEGFNPSTIEKAYRLVEEARREGEPVTVTGTLRVGPHQELESGIFLELKSVKYRDTEIRTDEGPFVRDYPYYPPYYYGPLLWPYGYYPYWHWY